MSKIFENEYGIYISHEKFINDVYHSINYSTNHDLFKIFTQYKRSNQKPKRFKGGNELKNSNEEKDEVASKFDHFFQSIRKLNLYNCNEQCDCSHNKMAMDFVDNVHRNLPNNNLDLIGANVGPSVLREVNNFKCLFPENCNFFAKDVFEINRYLLNKKYDLILLDPPWWNKYIRRKRKASSDAYKMIHNTDLKNLPINKLLAKDGIVAVWCTNSEQNVNALLTDIFPTWNVSFTAKWYWVKVTTKCQPICNFSDPPGKQPYEKIIFGYRNRSLPLPSDRKLIVSVPSAMHSHKPPLTDLLAEFLPKNPKCLEVFARYLLPGWTSYGNEVLKLQHESLFIKQDS